ncbi:hypothetical protein MferCBS31731_003504 [Microsporum ferrugineum]
MQKRSHTVRFCVSLMLQNANYLIALGISFGPTYITAAYIDSAGEPVVVASIRGSDEYRDFVADSAINEGVKVQSRGKWYIRDGESLVPILPEPDNNPEAEDIFTAAIRSIREEITKSKGQVSSITSISIPSHFNRTSTTAMINAVMENEKGIIRPWQVRKQFHVVRLAYGLNSCEGFGLDSDTCDMEDPEHVMFVDYHNEYLELVLASVGEFSVVALDSVRLHNLGAKRLDNPKVGNQDSNIYQHEIQDAIQRFKESNNIRMEDYPTTIEVIRAIVMSGDAPKPAFASIREAIAAVLPEHKSKIRDSIDPLSVDAVGAAQWAKLQVLNSELLHDASVLHDEL